MPLKIWQRWEAKDLAEPTGIRTRRRYLGTMELKQKTLEKIITPLLEVIPENHFLEIENTKKSTDGWMDISWSRAGKASLQAKEALLEAKAPTDPEAIRKQAIKAAKLPTKKEKAKAEKDAKKHGAKPVPAEEMIKFPKIVDGGKKAGAN